MALVNYPDSDQSEDDSSGSLENNADEITPKITPGERHHHHRSKSNSSLPPLPDSFHNLYTSDSRKGNQDDPGLHSGRQRATPHVEGNWPSHVYIEWYPSKEESTRIYDLMSGSGHNQFTEQYQVHSLLRSDLNTELPLHISLSRPLTLVTHERRAFSETLALEINRSNIRPFEVSLRGLDWVSNNEKTRWFLAMHVSKPPMNELNKILKISNDVAMQFRNLPLYTDRQSLPQTGSSKKVKRNVTNGYQRAPPYSCSYSRELQSDAIPDASSHFHVSIGWSLTPPTEAISTWVKSRTDEDLNFHIPVRSIKVKIGNSVTAITLSSKLELSGGIMDT